jgi:ribosomal-protein-alanine N-acetyltransferase
MHDDLDRIMSVMQAAFDPAFGEAWSRRQVEDALVLGNCHYCIAQCGEEAAGFYLSRHGFEEEELLLIAVHPRFRGRGFGQQLLDDLAQQARLRGAQRLLLEMRRNNPAEVLYRRNGFVPIGERINYYRTPTGERLDAITFARNL